MPVIPGTKKVSAAGLSMGERKVARARYDFATEGGTAGDIALTRGDKIPSGALIAAAFVNVTTVPTSGGAATIAVKVEGAADLNAADAISGAPWSTTGFKKLDAVGAANQGVKTTAERTITITVGTADLTAGVFDVLVEYFELA